MNMQQVCPMMFMQQMHRINPMMIESPCLNCYYANNAYGINPMYRNYYMNNYMINQNLFYADMRPVSIEEIED